LAVILTAGLAQARRLAEQAVRGQEGGRGQHVDGEAK